MDANPNSVDQWNRDRLRYTRRGYLTQEDEQRAREEQKLESLMAELLRLQDDLVEAETLLASLRRELSTFEQKYLRIVGVKLAQLDGLTAQIADTLATLHRTPEAERTAREARRRAAESSEVAGDRSRLATDEKVGQPQDMDGELKSLFRRVAKAVHPDLAVDEEDRQVRERCMAAANRAYQDGDTLALNQILNGYVPHSPAAYTDIDAEELRLLHAMHAIRSRLGQVADEIAALRSRDIHLLWEEDAAARSNGRDLLKEMSSLLDERIAQARNQLRDLGYEAVAP